MTIAALFVWLLVAALIYSGTPLHTRANCWWLALLWPLALAIVAAILFYEIAIYRPIVHRIVAGRRQVLP